MVSRAGVLYGAVILFLASSAAVAGESAAAGASEDTAGRKLQGAKYNYGDLKSKTKQYGKNVAIGSGQTNQANVAQNNAAVGNDNDSSNNLAISQSNGRKLQGAKYNYGDLKSKTKQYGTNVAIGSGQTNQANVAQNNAAVGNGNDSSNNLSLSQSNGRKLQGAKYNYGSLWSKTKQSGTNIAVGSYKTNQANVAQNNAAVGNGNDSSNNLAISQSNGRKM